MGSLVEVSMVPRGNLRDLPTILVILRVLNRILSEFTSISLKCKLSLAVSRKLSFTVIGVT